MELHLAATLALLGLGLFAGWLGALVGLGGGVVVIPALVLGFGLDIRVAVATSLVAVVATSTAAGSVFVGKGLANMRLGMTLEVFTTLGGIAGGLLALRVPQAALGVVFAALITVTAVLMLRQREVHGTKPGAGAGDVEPPGVEERGHIAGEYYDAHLGALVPYRARRVLAGGAVSFVAGILSGLLGVGGGFIKVPAMTMAMGVPFKVAAATSNFMIGVTAAASLFIYFSEGLVHPALAAPVALGVVGGALAGTATARRVSAAQLKRVLAVVLVFVAVQMVLRALGVSLGR
jgi:uncharacterized membrane protein YfcA